MRLYFLLISIMTGLCPVFGNGIAHFVTVDNDEIITVMNINWILPDGIYSFSSEDGSPVDWDFYIYSDYEAHECYLACSSVESSARFEVNPATLDWKRAEKIYVGERNYYKGMMEISSSADEIVDAVELTFNLLPSKIKIKSIEYDCQYNWDLDMIDFRNSPFTIDFECENVESLLVRYYVDFVLELSEELKPNRFLLSEFLPIERAGSINRIVIKNIDWAQAFYFEVRNPYGLSKSDYILSTDYIEDPAIMEKYNDFFGLTELENVAIPMKIVVKNGFLHICGEENNVESISIFDMTGRMLYRQSDGNDINLSYYLPGYYVARLHLKNNETKTLKFRI
ncbi:MAG: T9SS type A sorting domain-containing protein [Muribaculum sp.]|nr:T9SS type A sorting domain-containing protein [Muribaculum sp.]